MIDEVHPSHWYTTNLVGIPAAVIGSAAFNSHPQPLRVAGARESNRGLFSLLERCTAVKDAREVFFVFLRPPPLPPTTRRAKERPSAGAGVRAI